MVEILPSGYRGTHVQLTAVSSAISPGMIKGEGRGLPAYDLHFMNLSPSHLMLKSERSVPLNLEGCNRLVFGSKCFGIDRNFDNL